MQGNFYILFIILKKIPYISWYSHPLKTPSNKKYTFKLILKNGKKNVNNSKYKRIFNIYIYIYNKIKKGSEPLAQPWKKVSLKRLIMMWKNK